MKTPALTAVAEIKRLHGEIDSAARRSIKSAIRIGKLLERQREGMEHGEWLPWIKKHLPFSDHTARNYIRVYENRERLKLETISDLTHAYRWLEAPRAEPVSKEQREVWKEASEAPAPNGATAKDTDRKLVKHDSENLRNIRERWEKCSANDKGEFLHSVEADMGGPIEVLKWFWNGMDYHGSCADKDKFVNWAHTPAAHWIVNMGKDKPTRLIVAWTQASENGKSEFLKILGVNPPSKR